MEFSGQFSSSSEDSDKGSKSEKSASSRPVSFERPADAPKPAQEGVIQLHHNSAESLSRPVLGQFLQEKSQEDRKAKESDSETKKEDRPAAAPAPAAESKPISLPLHPPNEAVPIRPPHQTEAAPDKKDESSESDDDDTAATPVQATPTWPKPIIPQQPRAERAEPAYTESDEDTNDLPLQATTEYAEPVTGSGSAEAAEMPAAEAAADLPPVPHAESVDDLPPVGGGATAESPVFAMPDTLREEPPTPPTPPVGGGGGGRPPFGPPPGPPSEFGGAGGPGAPEPSPVSGPDFYSRPVFAPSEGASSTEAFSPAAMQSNMEQPVDPFAASRAEMGAEQRGLRRGLIAGFITGYVVKQYLANRKMRRVEAAHDKQVQKQEQQIYGLQGEQISAQDQLRRQQEQLTQLSQQQQQAERGPHAIPGFEVPAQQRPVPRMEQPLTAAASTHAPFERVAGAAGPAPRAETPFAAPGQQAEAVQPQPGVPLEQQQAQELVAKAFELEPGQHVEHSAWHNIVVDERGREVQGAITYGEAFQQERQKEQAVAAVSDDQQQQQQRPADTGAPGGVPGFASPSSFANPYAANNPLLQSGQINPPNQLQAGQPSPVDPQHRLEDDTRTPLAAAVANPWLWAGVTVLLVAFFAAALI